MRRVRAWVTLGALSMFLRVTFLSALLGPAALTGCASAPPPPPRVAPAAPPAGTSRRALGVAPELDLDRPSELTPVTEDHADPEAKRLFQARIAQLPVPLAPTVATVPVTELALDDTRRGEAPGMKQEGSIFMATLEEGQRGTVPVHVGPDECVTFIAQGGLGVIEVDLFLTDREGTEARILAQDPATGPIAVIGGRGRCSTGAREKGTDAVLHAAVRRGAGVVLVGVYKKK
jgi:hypothetical protein